MPATSPPRDPQLAATAAAAAARAFPFAPEEEADARIPRDRLLAHQLDRLDAILAAALPGPSTTSPADAPPALRFLARHLRRDYWPAGSLCTIDDLRALPLTTRADLVADQTGCPPYGTLPTAPLDRFIRLFQTSGTTSGHPLRWLYDRAAWEHVLHCWSIIFRAAGVGAGDAVFFPFSFGPFLGFWAAFEGADRLGARCLPGGGMSSAARLRFLFDNAATTVCCTPTYALRLADAAADEGLDLAAGPVRTLIVAGEPGGSLPAVRARIEQAWGARCLDHTGMTEVGSLGVEFRDEPDALYLLETACIAEVIDPATGHPLDDDDARETGGELVLTSLANAAMPLVRYRTGDAVLLDRRPSPATGRTFARLVGGLRGRLDDMLLIKGNNVYPSAIEEVIREVGGVAEYRIEVRQRPGGTHVTVLLEPAVAGGSARADVEATRAEARLERRLREALRDRLQFSADVRTVDAGALPRFEMKARRVVVVEDDGDDRAPASSTRP